MHRGEEPLQAGPRGEGGLQEQALQAERRPRELQEAGSRGEVPLAAESLHTL